MSDRHRRRAQEGELRQIEARLKRGADSIELRFRRARLLDALGRSDEAHGAYVDVLKRDRTHFGALNDFGMLLYKNGLVADARTCYMAAVAHHPNNPIGHANLAYLLLKNGEAQAARAQYETALKLDPENLEAHRGLAIALEALGDVKAAQIERRLGFEGECLTTLPYRGSGRPIRVLQLVTVTAGNVSTGRFLDDRLFQISKLVAEFYRPDLVLPAHDIVFNALGDADVCVEGLLTSQAVIARSSAPVINDPAAVLQTGRAQNARRLGQVEDVVTAAIEAFPRSDLEASNAIELLQSRGFRFPLLVRSPGFHTGHNFVRIERPDDFAAAVAQLPGQELLVLEFLDARGADGKVRKYRAMIVDGAFYPLHLAVAHDWKVHYFSADMADNAEHRAEDARFLDDMRGSIGDRAYAALERVRDALNLDYAGIDFSLDAEGRVLLFEANATMVIPAPKKEEVWAYRAQPVDRLIEATQKMIIERSRSHQYALT